MCRHHRHASTYIQPMSIRQPIYCVRFCFLIVGLIGLTAVASGASGESPSKVLFIGDAGRNHQPHERFQELNAALTKTSVELDYTESLERLNEKELASYDAIILYADIDQVDPKQESALIDFVKRGGGFVPIHCASACFNHSPKFVDLIGARFLRHGSGVFRTEVAETANAIAIGYGGFESWDETYVHTSHQEAGRTVLEYRVDRNGREPWTWIKPYGNGRVFYTAWGHDGRTWTHPGFQNLVLRGILWVTRQDPETAGRYEEMMAFPVPEIPSLPDDLPKMSRQKVGSKLPKDQDVDAGSGQPDSQNWIQGPLPPQESMRHIVVPDGFHMELFAAEPDLGGKPICMAWDAAGRLWVGETIDYPNSLSDDNRGNDRIRICEDTDHDGRADRFTVFADGLSIPSAITFSHDGVIVQNGTETLYLQDTDGDDVADIRNVLLSNWSMSDTHGGVSNFQYGPDNWIWGMQGYNQSQPIAADAEHEEFRMGFFRMRPDGSEVEFIRSTNNNTWGLGFSEEGFVFGSTANGAPSVFMPIANRYYERVMGWLPSLTLPSIADTPLFKPITDKVRQGDWQGGYTAATGHALYTAREYPMQYWNRAAFVNGPTGHLVGAFVLSRQGTEFRSTNPFNLIASDDEWTAPIMSEVGPDGQVWVIDWYNYIVQHNAATAGVETGKGEAYETDLRDKTRGRIYRVVADKTSVPSQSRSYPDLSSAGPAKLIEALSHPTMLVRKHAQRLLVERGQADVCASLVKLVDDRTVDAIGLNVGVIHALWTLEGLGLLTQPDSSVSGLTSEFANNSYKEQAHQAVIGALSHPSAGVRRVAAGVLPKTCSAIQGLLDADLMTDRDRHVRLAALLAISDCKAKQIHSDPLASARDADRLCDQIANTLVAALRDPNNLADRWIPDGLTSAAAMHSDAVLLAVANPEYYSDEAAVIIEHIAEHHMRTGVEEGRSPSQDARLLAELCKASPNVLEAVIEGFFAVDVPNTNVSISAVTDSKLEFITSRVSSIAESRLVRLATGWGSHRFAKQAERIGNDLLKQVHDNHLSTMQRIEAAKQLMALMPDDRGIVLSLLNKLTPSTSDDLGIGIVESLSESRWDGWGNEVIGRLSAMRPAVREAAMSQLLLRPNATLAMLDAARRGRLMLSDLPLETRAVLVSHPDSTIRSKAKSLLAAGDDLPHADRDLVVRNYAKSTLQKGNPKNGLQVFVKNCSQCHVHCDRGNRVGPDLTGMATLPKKELLLHILDPNRNVEANYRSCTVLTVDGVIRRGVLTEETRTTIGFGLTQRQDQPNPT